MELTKKIVKLKKKNQKQTKKVSLSSTWIVKTTNMEPKQKNKKKDQRNSQYKVKRT